MSSPTLTASAALVFSDNYIAGASSTPFAADAVEAIFEIGRGNLRATDRVALKAMEVAWQRGSAAVDANHAIEARQQLWP